MKYFNVDMKHEFNSILCGRLIADNFVHMERIINIHVLIIVEQGILNIEIGKKQYKVRHGESIVLPANIPHKGFKDTDTDGHIEYFWAHFVTESNFSIGETVSEFSVPLHFTLSDYARVRILYNQLLDVHQLGGLRKKYCDFLFTALCFEISAQSEYETASGNKIVNKAVAWIELNINSPISLEQIADALGYNKRYLTRIFKENLNVTVNEYIMEKKLTVAKQLLTGSDETISSIASTLGFDDAGYFMRVFKKHEGITCREYRNAYSKMYLNKI